MKNSTFALCLAVALNAANASADEATGPSASQAEVPAEDTEPSAAAVAAETSSTAEPTVMLHVKSPDRVVAIEREDTGEVVCTSPCNKEVPATVRYRVGGYHPSDAFVLEGHGGRAKISVAAATKRDFVTGAAVLGTGGALVLGGVLALALGYASQGNVPGAEGVVTDTTYSDTMIAGTALVVAGVTAGIWGGATLASNLKSSVTGNVLKAPPARGSAQPPRTTAATELRSVGPTFFMPLFGGVF